MRKIQRVTTLGVVAVLVMAAAAMRPTSVAIARPQPSATSFHFVFSADSRDNYTVLPDFSHKMASLNPVFGLFGGDLCGSFDVNCINNTWKPAMDGNNNDGMLAKTFALRGNHDNGTLSTWQSLWDFQTVAANAGITHYTEQTSDATYSFDYGNSHFAAVDVPGGGSNTWTSAQISWLDNDLTAAESRGVVHEFLFAHGPMYGVTAEHGSESPSAALKAVLNKHPISAGFHGHEHVTQYTHVTTSVQSGINRYDEFTLGRAGAPPYTVVKPVDWSASQNAFADVAVNGNDFTVTVYSQSGAALFSKTFTDSGTRPAYPVDVYVAGLQLGSYPLSSQSSDLQMYSGVNNGPVRITNSVGQGIVASERVAYFNGAAWTSYSELLGLPASQLTDTYYFPWYNSTNLSSQISVGNVGTASTNVTITIAGRLVDSYALAANASKRVKYAGLNTGPVVVRSSGGVPIIASERVSYTPDGTHYTSYSELMGLPASQLTDTYDFSYYNGVSLSEQVSVANVGSSNTTVTVTIGGSVIDSYTLGPNASKRVKYPGVNNGPVVVHSSGGTKIIASERISYTPDGGATYTGYSEMMGLPSAKLTDTYTFPWYNSVDHSMQVSAANVGSGSTSVTVTINGTVVDSYTLAQNASKRVKYAGLTNGPVVVHSSGGIKIIASERTSYTADGGASYPSFSEMLGLPNGLLTNTYVFPWYNNVNLNTELRFGVP